MYDLHNLAQIGFSRFGYNMRGSSCANLCREDYKLLRAAMEYEPESITSIITFGKTCLIN
jgi:hypothetical protein